jgi:hypothetical protein
MKEYTLNEKQIKKLVDDAFKLGVNYCLDAVKREYDFKTDNGFGYNKIDHSGDAKNSIITNVLIKTTEHYLDIRNSGKFNLFTQ